VEVFSWDTIAMGPEQSPRRYESCHASEEAAVRRANITNDIEAKPLTEMR